MMIFYLDKDIQKCASAYGDKHCVKIILEITQMLFTAHWVNVGECSYELAYKPSYKNHPMGIWVQSSPFTYNWACRLGLQLCKEYTERFPTHREHKCERHLSWLLDNPPFPDNGSYKPWTPPPVPKGFENIADHLEAHRKYYRHKLALGIVDYKYSPPPAWLIPQRNPRASPQDKKNENEPPMDEAVRKAFKRKVKTEPMLANRAGRTTRQTKRHRSS